MDSYHIPLCDLGNFDVTRGSFPQAYRDGEENISIKITLIASICNSEIMSPYY